MFNIDSLCLYKQTIVAYLSCIGVYSTKYYLATGLGLAWLSLSLLILL